MLLPNYYVAWIISFIVYHIKNQNRAPLVMAAHFLQSIPELLFVSQAGFLWRNYNGVTWYISVMLLSMAIIYPLGRKYKDFFFNVIAPIAFIILFGSLFSRFGKLTADDKWTGFYCKNFVRGFSELLAGCICYKVVLRLKKIDFTNIAKLLFMILEWILYLSAIIYMYYHKASKYDFIIVFVFMMAVSITLSGISFDSKIFNHKFFYWLGAFSLDLYLGHNLWRSNIPLLFPSLTRIREKLVCYMLLSFATALFIMYFSKFLSFVWRKLKPAVVRVMIKSDSSC